MENNATNGVRSLGRKNKNPLIPNCSELIAYEFPLSQYKAGCHVLHFCRENEFFVSFMNAQVLLAR
jgi:hypothetical protein